MGQSGKNIQNLGKKIQQRIRRLGVSRTFLFQDWKPERSPIHVTEELAKLEEK